MHFISLDLENIGVYRGTHHFLLEPLNGISEPKRTMTIIYGRNGSGKSTLFRSIQLSLFGRLALGDRVSQKQYHDYLIRYLTDQSTPSTPSSISGSVTARFQFAKSGEKTVVTVRRDWQLESGNLKEDLSVLINGQAPDILDEDSRVKLLQETIYEYIPPELADICFFDTEQLDSLSSPESHNKRLGFVMRRFLGLDIIARLSNDIERYLDECMRAEGGTRENASLRNRMLDVQKLKDHLNTELESVLVERLQLSERKNKAEILLKRSERQLVSQGGTYAEKRQFLQEQHNRLESDHQARQNALIDLCNDLLPFSLVPELLHDLESTLKREADQKRKDLAADLFKDTCRSLVRTFEDESLWNGLNVHAETRDELLRRLSSAVNSYPLNGLRESTVIHDITDIERQRITEWIRIAATETPNKVERLCDDLRSLDQMIVKIRIEMDKAPDDVLLAHVYQEIHEAQAEVSDLILKESKIQETIGTLQYRISETDRELRIMRDKLIKLQSAEHNLDLANRSLLVLKTYEDALVRTKIQDIEEKIVRSFNTLCHKSRLLSRITIDLDDYSLSLYSTNDKKIFLSDLSAGERQLYVISLLWALRQVSEKDIPLFVDTPVAKLDELHGWQLMHDFFPRVSNQVILFAHTKEMDNGLLQEAAFYTARRYKLDFDDTRKRTQVQCEESPVSGLLIR